MPRRPDNLTLPPLFTRAFILAALANALLNFAAFLFVHLPGFLQQLGAGEAQIGRIMAAQAVGAIAVAPFAGRAMDTRGRRVVILAGVALFVTAVAMYLTIRSLSLFAYAVRVLDGAATTMWYTALFTYAADLVPVERRTEGLAIFGISGLVAIGLGAQVGEVILAYTTYRGLFFCAMVLAALGLTLCIPLRDIPPTDSEPRGRARHVLATTVQRDLLPVWCAVLAFFVAVVALFTFMKTFVTATGAGSVGAFFGVYASSRWRCGLSRGGFPSVSARDARSGSQCRVTPRDWASCRLRTHLVTSSPPGCCAELAMAIRFQCS